MAELNARDRLAADILGYLIGEKFDELKAGNISYKDLEAQAREQADQILGNRKI